MADELKKTLLLEIARHCIFREYKKVAEYIKPLCTVLCHWETIDQGDYSEILHVLENYLKSEKCLEDEKLPYINIGYNLEDFLAFVYQASDSTLRLHVDPLVPITGSDCNDEQAWGDGGRPGMLLKRTHDEEHYVKWAEMREGTVQKEGYIIAYRLSYLCELALLGKTRELEEQIVAGAPALDLDTEVIQRLKTAMYIECLEEGSVLFRPEEMKHTEECPVFFTAPEAAYMAGQAETFDMLLSKGADFDERCERTRKVLAKCRERLR